ncbi:sulfotransferase [soil metagenome]
MTDLRSTLPSAPAEKAIRATPTAPDEPEAIFIVGVSRSGTTLLRRILDSHSRIAIATENHYLGHLVAWEGARVYFRRVGDLREDAAVHRLVELIYSDGFQRRSRFREVSPYWRWLVSKVDRGDLESRLLASDRSERVVFETFLRLYADRRGKAIMGEKTPAHLGYAETLLDWFPGARVVHMMRDPRAVYVSELRRRMERPESVPYRWLIHVPLAFQFFVLLQVCLAWSAAVRRHRQLAVAFPQAYRLLRFEELVAAPDATLTELCAFLGVLLEPRMLQQKVISKGARAGESGFDAGAADRWRDAIGQREERLIRALVGRRLGEMGYQP